MSSRRRASAAVADATSFLAPRRFTLAASLVSAFARRPMDCLGLAAVLVAAGVILANALYLQKGRHPAPILPRTVQPGPTAETTGSLVMIPRPRPAELDAAPKEAAAPARPRAQIVADVQRELSRRGFYDGGVDGIFGPRIDAAIREFEQAAGLKSTGEPSEALLAALARSSAKAAPRPSAPAVAAAAPGRRAEAAAPAPAVPAARVAAVQRALTDFGYGQVKPTGVPDPATKAAIEKFERDRKLPVTGQVSDRLARELGAVTGRPLE